MTSTVCFMFFLSRTTCWGEKKLFPVVAICDFYLSILCSGLKCFLVYVLKCYMQFRLLHFSLSGILPDICSILPDAEA